MQTLESHIMNNPIENLKIELKQLMEEQRYWSTTNDKPYCIGMCCGKYNAYEKVLKMLDNIK